MRVQGAVDNNVWPPRMGVTVRVWNLYQGLTRRPEVIVELHYGDGSSPGSEDLAPWNVLASVPAVRNRRIHVLVGDEFVVPGPRVALAAQRLAEALHR